jgi:capsular polysaccharide biosynthesis protein
LDITWDSDLAVVVRKALPAFTLPPPNLVGRELMPSDVRGLCDMVWQAGTFAARDVVVRRYADVFVVNQGLIVRALDQAVYKASISQHTEHDIAMGLQDLRHAIATDGVMQIDGPCVLCAKPGGDNYGHWLNEMLPRAHLARRWMGDGFRFIVPATTPALTRVIVESLAMIGIADDRIVWADRELHVDELYGVNGLTEHGRYMSPLTLQCLDEIADRVDAWDHPKVYVSRAGGVRKFANEPQVQRALAERGFMIADTAAMSFRDQVALFKGARRIVGCRGAGMTNIGFTPPGAAVTIFAPSMMADTFYWFLAGLKGHRYREVRRPVSPVQQGRVERDHDLLIDLDELVAQAEQ